MNASETKNAVVEIEVIEELEEKAAPSIWLPLCPF